MSIDDLEPLTPGGPRAGELLTPVARAASHSAAAPARAPQGACAAAGPRSSSPTTCWRSTADGSIELRATPQAINLLLDVMDVDIESAEKAAAYMFRLQVERGCLRSAAESAERMRRLSNAYQESIQQAILTAGRDIRQVDWAGRVMAEIEQAYAHVEERLREEAVILEDIAERHSTAIDAGHRRALLQIKELLEDCYRHHRELHTHLMEARGRLSEHHASRSWSLSSPAPA